MSRRSLLTTPFRICSQTFPEQLQSYSLLRQQGLSSESLKQKEVLLNKVPQAGPEELLRMAQLLVEDSSELKSIGATLVGQALQLVRAQKGKVNTLVKLIPDLVAFNSQIPDSEVALLSRYVQKNLEVLSVSGLTYALLGFARLGQEVERKQNKELLNQLCSLALANMEDMDLRQLAMTGESMQLMFPLASDCLFWPRLEQLLEESQLIQGGSVEEVGGIIQRMALVQRGSESLWEDLLAKYLESLQQALQQKEEVEPLVKSIGEVISASQELPILSNLAPRLDELLTRLLNRHQVSTGTLQGLLAALAPRRTVPLALWDQVAIQFRADLLNAEETFCLLHLLAHQADKLPLSLQEPIRAQFLSQSHQFSHTQLLDLAQQLKQHEALTPELRRLFELNGCLEQQ